MDQITADSVAISGTDSVVVTATISSTDLIAQQQAIIDGENQNIEQYNEAIATRQTDIDTYNTLKTVSQDKITVAQAVITKVTPSLPSA